jgi:hypothetical protein
VGQPKGRKTTEGGLGMCLEGAIVPHLPLWDLRTWEAEGGIKVVDLAVRSPQLLGLGRGLRVTSLLWLVGH